LKGLSEISAKATASPQRTAQSSGSNSSPPSRTAREFALTGRSNPPDPSFNAYRADLADVALAGQVIASHYAEPLARTVLVAAALKASPSLDAEAVAQLSPGDAFLMLDDTLGWAWGYAGKERRVGYVRSDAVERG
jgi:hypothetical protein